MINTIGRDVCAQLAEILPPMNARELICEATNKDVQLEELTAYESKDEYITILVETAKYIVEPLELEITSGAFGAFQRNVARVVNKFTADSDSRHGWKATHLSGIIVDILVNQATIRSDVRDAALCTLMY